MDEQIKSSGMNASKNALDGLFNDGSISKEIYEKLLELHFAKNKCFDEFIQYIKNSLMNGNYKKEKALVAFSGGVDSTASSIIGSAIFQITSVSAHSPHIITDETKKNIINLSEKLKITHEFLDVDLEDVLNDTISAKYHPCGRCHGAVEEVILNYAKKNNIKYIIYGDMLSIGHLSIRKVDEKIVRVNIPSFLTMTKNESRAVLSEFNIDIRQSYGCKLLKKAHKHEHMQKYTIQRILREVRAQVITAEEGFKNILDVVKIN
ncbi:ExsB family protein [Methanococcus vannielii SB]|uniref:ExsB family protein n=1 Tax=Methanococcus vannielii (strain ATCC 35089 / DSM 1224 / JCM 13029 / OCM 148 / SB) TaxID=406327 RepID=A6UQN5_METVS|nr:ExsB family transcriptional regulator [Methanococcus vannielii]ABR54807.1 ExsB family protein [Methanococcus vannielii SB]